MQSYNEQQGMEDQEDYVAEEELEEVPDSQTPGNESEEVCCFPVKISGSLQVLQPAAIVILNLSKLLVKD